MSAKAVREIDGKEILRTNLAATMPSVSIQCCAADVNTDWAVLILKNPWLSQVALVVKPDQLIKRRGKLGLILINATLAQVKSWVAAKLNGEVVVGTCRGCLRRFIIEPYVAHTAADEYYMCIHANRAGNHILFHHEGGVDIGDVDAKATVFTVGPSDVVSPGTIVQELLQLAPASRQKLLGAAIAAIYAQFVDLHFTYLEVNPLVVVNDTVHILDLAAKVDQTAAYLCHEKWGVPNLEFPPPFGRDLLPEEAYIAALDSKSGASLKLTILNPRGRIWTMVAGGGASVIYSDTICDLGGTAELANYGEYSGAPSTSQTYEYARTLLGLMTKEPHPDGKALLIGGGIANFTNVAATFKGIAKALTELHDTIKQHRIRIYVRRGGPNYQEGLAMLRALAVDLDLQMLVYGPETHMTSICAMALGLLAPPPSTLASTNYMESMLTGAACAAVDDDGVLLTGPDKHQTHDIVQFVVDTMVPPLFGKTTRALIFGMQTQAVQGMLDFDWCCGRTKPSVAGMINPFSGGTHMEKFYWGASEILIHVFPSMEEACKVHADVQVVVNFASLRSAHDVTMAAIALPQITVIAVIAEGIPENLTRVSNAAAKACGKIIIGPATVGGVKPGCFKIGNTGGMIDNIIASKLYRPGSVAYVSRSGGMSNELNNIISRNTNGVYEGVAIGGDRYPGTTFLDHLMRYEADPNAKLLVLLGEVGGVEEYDICEALRLKKISKPLVAWCIGTCGTLFNSEVQFGHAGASAHGDRETAAAKNAALRAAGATVPASFDSLGQAIKSSYMVLVGRGIITPTREPVTPKVPIDYKWARELGLVRKPANFVSSVSDERGEELLYAGVPITRVMKDNIGIGGVIGLLWFQRPLPPFATKFIEMCLMITADHGPAVSGAHNTMVAARAGKDLVSSLCSGLLTIGDRFGGALDEAAQQYSTALDAGQTPRAFVEAMHKQRVLISGIGHRVKSTTNPDMRVTLIKEYAKTNFAKTPLLDFALQVEQLTTAKKPNLILNVDGCIAACFVDLLRECGAFSAAEAREYIAAGTLNALFVLGRTTGFIGHFLDQKRLKQGLYRHPWDDINYLETATPAACGSPDC